MRHTQIETHTASNERDSGERGDGFPAPRFGSPVHVWLLLLSLALVAPEASAFRTKTHLWVAQQALMDVADGCSYRTDARHCVTIEICVDRDPDDRDLVFPWTPEARCFEREYAISSEVARSLVDHGAAYRAGHIGPDAFPDLLVGQRAAHPGIDGAWQADDWLEWLLRHADDDASRAFTLGWAGHMAGDVFGHTWVNAYAGDTFALTDGEQTVERRHFAIEAFADRFTPDLGLSDEDLFRPPYGFVARRLVLDEAIAEQLTEPLAAGGHLLVMYAVHRALREAERPLADLPALKAFDQIHDFRHRIHETALEIRRLGDPKKAARRHIEAAKAVLAAHDAVIAEQEEAVHAARNTVSDLLKAKNEAEDLIRRAPAKLEQLEGEVDRLRSKLEGTAKWTEKRIADKVCKTLDPTGITCQVFETKYRIEKSVSSAWKRIEGDLKGARNDLEKFRARLEQSRKDVVELPKKQVEAEAVRVSAEALLAGLRIKRDADRQGEEALNRAKRTLAELEEREAELLARIEALERQMDPLLGPAGGLRGLREFLRAWRRDVEKAVEAYVEAGEDSAKAFLNGSDPLEPYQEWLKCWGPALTGVPSPITRAGCAVVRTVEDFVQQVEELRAEFHQEVGETGGWLLDPGYKAKQEVEKLLGPALENGAFELVEFVGGPETRTLVEMIRFEATDDNIDELFKEDQSGRKLLLIPDASKRLRLDMAVADGKLSPLDFDAFRNAVTLTKLTLLDPKELNRLAEDCGVWPPTTYGETLFPNRKRFNILTDAIRSLDGDHQWNTFAPRRLRRPGYRDDSSRQSRTFGYPAPGGFRLWRSRKARRLVFLGIFRGPLTPGLLDLIPDGHGHRPSADDPFPVIR